MSTHGPPDCSDVGEGVDAAVGPPDGSVMTVGADSVGSVECPGSLSIESIRTCEGCKLTFPSAKALTTELHIV